MSEPIYEEVANEKLLNQLHQNLEHVQNLKKVSGRVSERIRRDQETLLDYEAQRKVLMDAVWSVVISVDGPIIEEEL